MKNSDINNKAGVKKAMEMVKADINVTVETVLAKTGLKRETAVRAMKLAAAGVTPREMSGVETLTRCQEMDLPKLLSSIIKKKSKEFEERKDLTENSAKGWRTRAGTKEKKSRVGDTIPLARDLSSDYCSATKGLPISMDKNGIISSRTFLDPKTGVYFRETVRLVIETVPVGASTNRNMLSDLTVRQ